MRGLTRRGERLQERPNLLPTTIGIHPQPVKLQKISILTAGILSTLLVGNVHAGLVINATFASSITGDANASAIEAGINAAISRVQNAIASNVTVNITFQEGGGLGGSSTYIGSIPYSAYLNALQTQQVISANDTKAIASLPAGPNNPVNGNSDVFLTTPLLRALGFSASVASDSTITLNTSIMNLSRTGAQNGSFYDLQAVAAHEIDEVLGIGGPGSALPSLTGAVGVLDLFRYSAAGVRSFTTSSSATSYFSIDGGVTDIVGFNQAGGGSDYSDWASTGTKRVQDAYGTPGADVDIGSAELTALDVVGYDLVPVPEPASISIFFAAALGTVGMLTRKRGRAQA